MSELDPAPLQLATVLSPEWLTDSLTDLDGAKVVDTSVVETLKTVASKVRFTATVETADGRRADRGYCVKGYFDAETLGGGASEARFYRDLADTITVRRPPCVYVGIDEGTGHSLHIMDDLVVAGCRFLTALTPYTPAEATSTLAALAVLHADTWHQDTLAGTDWLAPRILGIADRFPVDMLQGLLDDGRCDPLPEVVHGAERLTAAVRVLGDRDAADRHCVVHGDTHAGNVYVDPDDNIGIIDWQVVHYGHWALDVAYHVGSVLTIDDRRAHEEELLRGYLDELTRLGGTPPAWDEAWDQYRAHAAWAYYMWGITRFVDRPIILEFIERLGTAVADHDAYGLLGV
jgi:Phosphotransferase enzyme family